MSLDPYEVSTWIRDNALQSLQPRPRSICLFGSFVRGESHSDSDIDLLIISDSIPKKAYARAVWIRPLLSAWYQGPGSVPGVTPLSPLMMDEQGWLASTGLRLSLSTEAWVLWDDGFLSASLNESALLIAQGKYVRKTYGSNGWFWEPQKPTGGKVA